MRNNAFNVAYCGIMCALALIVMFFSLIPAMNYIMPAISGVIVWSTVPVASSRSSSGCASTQCRWGWLSYMATSLLALMLAPEIESKVLFILLFGYFPLIRERLHILLRIVIFNLAAVVMYLSVTHIFGVDGMLEGLDGFGKYAVYVLWGMGNVAFCLYDFALKYVFYAFFNWVKPALNKKIK